MNKRLEPILNSIADYISSQGSKDKVLVIVPAFRHMFAGETFPIGYKHCGVSMLIYDDFYDFTGNPKSAEDRTLYLDKLNNNIYVAKKDTSHGSWITNCMYYWRDFTKEDELNEAM